VTTTYDGTAKYYRSGTHRIRTPDETLADYWPKAQALGVTRLANMTGLDWIGIPVYNAIRPNSRSLAVSQGKGVSPVAAKVSALMESVEYWHAEHVVLPLRSESYQQLARETNVVDVHRLPLRGGLDSMSDGVRETPARATIRPDLPLLWVDALDLQADRPIMLPFEMVSLNKVGINYAQNTFRMDSNGLASGNCRAEAIVHGICELVERDALTLWWQDVQRPSDVAADLLDPSSVDDQACRELLERLGAAGLDTAVWDVTSDIGIPVYQCCVLERAERVGWRPFGASWGYGAHPATAVALARALTEAAQSRITMIAGSRDDNFPSQYRTQHDPARLASIRQLFFGAPGHAHFRGRAGVDLDTVDGDLATMLGLLRTAGLDSVVVADLTRPEIGIPTVKVVIPDLEYFSLFIGYVPGRRAQERAHRQGRRLP
jgi:ribosomal protein S12 methylthiotransferase accessory factor